MNSPPTTTTIVNATGADTRTAARLVAEAFEPLLVCEWLVPDPTQRVAVLAADFAIHVEHAVDHGRVHLTGDKAAVAVWIDNHTEPAPPPPDYQTRLASACGAWTDRFQLLDELFDAHHPHEPHHHLALLAVHPDRQRQGLGSALLAHHHAHLDQHGIPTYLEASSERSRDLYLRNGYEPTGDPFPVPNGALFWPMWRPPRTTPPAG